MNINKLYIILSIALLISCSKKETEEAVNQTPILNITTSSEGLYFHLGGTITDTDGSVSKLLIEWGDSSVSSLHDSQYDSLNMFHHYEKTGSYDILLTAFDNKDDSSMEKIPVIVDFEETSLAGIKESMFKTADHEYLILTINQHTYQETFQNEKFNIMIDLIGKMDIDFIAFQEDAQHKTAPITEGIIRDDNMSLIIANGLKEKYNTNYHFVWNWAHYGWDVWEEGISIMSKYPLLDQDQKYISSITSHFNIQSRKAIYGAFQTPHGVFNAFSTHTHWRTSESSEEQNNQIKDVKLMMEEKEALYPDALSFVCGDFNGNPTSDYPWSEGYHTMMRNNDFWDSFLEIYPEANNKPAQSIYRTVGGDFPGRIDYIFVKKNDRIHILDSQIVFKTDVVGMVSDHFGVLTKIRVD